LAASRSDKAGCLATVEVERELETPKNRPPQAGHRLSLGCKMVHRILSGQPEASEAPVTIHIRASDAARHERRKR
jgi:hypothetical protein